MIPLRDVNKSKTIPFVNYILIAACGLVFLLESSMSEESLGLFIHRFAVNPERVSGVVFQHHLSIYPLIPLVTSMFLHGGWMHLVGNMLYLYVFGDNVEDRIGHLGYLFFYLLCGIGASIVEVYFHQDSSVPLLGASGAIAG
ncbi:MAG: rhomboid family intramembrane serine protease, partial [Bacteroidota bacterium]